MQSIDRVPEWSYCSRLPLLVVVVVLVWVMFNWLAQKGNDRDAFVRDFVGLEGEAIPWAAIRPQGSACPPTSCRSALRSHE